MRHCRFDQPDRAHHVGVELKPPGRLVLSDRKGAEGAHAATVRGPLRGGAKPRPAIGKISIRVVPDSATEIAELLSRRAEWLSQITADQVDQLKMRPNLQAFSSAVLRVAFILFDAAAALARTTR